MVFCFQNVLTFCEKNCISDLEKTFEIQSTCKTFEIPSIIYSKSERSLQYMKHKCFLTCSWRFLRSNYSKVSRYTASNLDLIMLNTLEKLKLEFEN